MVRNLAGALREVPKPAEVTRDLGNEVSVVIRTNPELQSEGSRRSHPSMGLSTVIELASENACT